VPVVAAAVLPRAVGAVLVSYQRRITCWGLSQVVHRRCSAAGSARGSASCFGLLSVVSSSSRRLLGAVALPGAGMEKVRGAARRSDVGLAGVAARRQAVCTLRGRWTVGRCRPVVGGGPAVVGFLTSGGRVAYSRVGQGVRSRRTATRLHPYGARVCNGGGRGRHDRPAGLSWGAIWAGLSGFFCRRRVRWCRPVTCAAGGSGAGASAGGRAVRSACVFCAPRALGAVLSAASQRQPWHYPFTRASKVAGPSGKGAPMSKQLAPGRATLDPVAGEEEAVSPSKGRARVRTAREFSVLLAV
jgi:hypothetical protein